MGIKFSQGSFLNILFHVNTRPPKIHLLHTYEVHTLDVLFWLDLYPLKTATVVADTDFPIHSLLLNKVVWLLWSLNWFFTPRRGCWRNVKRSCYFDISLAFHPLPHALPRLCDLNLLLDFAKDLANTWKPSSIIVSKACWSNKTFKQEYVQNLKTVVTDIVKPKSAKAAFNLYVSK